LGAQAIMVGIDVTYKNGKPRLYDHRGARSLVSPTLDEWARRAADSGAGEIRLCSVDREGSRMGLDLALHDRLRSLVKVPIILEGGAGTLEHVAEAMHHGADSVSLGTLLVFSDNNLVKVRRFLGGAGLNMRP
jgi:cyclase